MCSPLPLTPERMPAYFGFPLVRDAKRLKTSATGRSFTLVCVITGGGIAGKVGPERFRLPAD
jgi:hypothetical protein